MGLFLIAVKRAFDERSGEEGLVDSDTASGEATAAALIDDVILTVHFLLQQFCRSSSRMLSSFLKLERAFAKLERTRWISPFLCEFLHSIAV